MSNYDGDLDARRRALEPGRSFIVEAPAGSGKTELLTQRLLRLLDCVERPEQVLAITFTRKAAAEMRQRVLETLRSASLPGAEVPAHRRHSLELARAAMRRSERLGWSLTEQTQRLRILTIDALNASLARRLPLLTGGVVSVRIADRADHLYLQAARRTVDGLADAGPVGAALRRLLEVADNSLSTLEAWLAAALPQRDRWIRELEGAADRGLAARMESKLGRLHAAAAERLRTLAGAERTAALRAMLEERRQVWPDAPDAPGEDDQWSHWREAASLLLTTKGTWRQRLTKREGLGSDAAALRESFEALRDHFATIEGLREALGEVAAMPPRQLDGKQTAMLDGLMPLLQRLLAELKLAFSASESVDHAELSLAAQQALGAVDDPSDLLLALDRRIEHILVDEFQDTSHLQWGLIERLTAGWQHADGRSLFLVGDPMQSIYRFRDADLSLFLRAREQGIGALRLEPVRLAVNHRSAGEVVDWVNATFPSVFGRDGGPATGPAFSAAIAARGPEADAGVSLEILRVEEYDEEIARVVEIVRAERVRNPEQSIGILVRNRSHLLGLRAALARERLPAAAIEIDSLSDTEFGLDLIALTAALLHEGDRLAWLAVLRGPCCGLGWLDLHRLVGGQRERTLRELIEDPARLEELSAEGRERARWLAERLRRGESLRAGLSLGSWIRECWLLIDGPACLAGADELAQAEEFFLQLDGLARHGDLDDPATLPESFSKASLRATAQQAGIELMTIHKAKGLEFDTVVLPGLSRSTRKDNSRLLIVQDFILPDGERICLLAGMAGRDDPYLRFLRRAGHAEELRERSRLLYVAATRARRRLYLLAALRGENARPRPDSLMALLGAEIVPADAAPEDLADEETAPEEAAGPATFRELPLERLRFGDEVPWPPTVLSAENAERQQRPEFEWAHPAAVQVGTLIHRELQRLCEAAKLAGRPVAPQRATARYRRELALLGIEAEDLRAAAERVAEALERLWSDPVGQRILHPWPEAWSELRLSWQGPDRIEHLRIDRSFVDAEGLRWIVDYKTGRHLGADVEAFLDSEVERYAPQLERYAEAVAAIDPRPIRVGLYFPLLQRFRDWVPAIAAVR